MFHQKQFELFQTMRNNNSLAHAYLFSGPTGVGKYSFARMLALWLQGNEPNHLLLDFTECTVEHPDIYTITAPLPVKEARELLHLLTTTPFLGPYKIVILNNAEHLSLETTNTLLKTLEEPRGNTLFFLITRDARLVPETIRSRCYALSFFLIPDKVIEARLHIKPIAHLKPYWSHRPRYADKLLHDRAYRKRIEAQVADAELFFTGSLKARFEINEKYAKIKDSTDLLEVLRIWLEYVHATIPDQIDILRRLLKLYQTMSTTNANAFYQLNNLAVALKPRV